MDAPLHAACTGCAAFNSGVNWGTVTIDNLKEASGISASRRNPGVFWTHNDGARQNVYAVDAKGARLATFNLDTSVDDVEDVAVGPGPVAGVSYLYFGDIGGSNEKNNIRAQVTILRLPEPLADLACASAPHSTNLTGVETFTLVYPDASHDAETLMVDPLTAELFVITKQTNAARVYRASLAGATNHATLDLEFVRELAFVLASGGDIAADGAQIILRREDSAMLWQRCDGEPLEAALGRGGFNVPILGPPTEPNGEGIGFLPGGAGYVTLSEGVNPTLHYFGAQCPSPPGFALPISDVSEFAGGLGVFQAIVVGYPAPTLSWTRNGDPLAGQTNATLILTNLALTDAGEYLLTASNASGVAASQATLVVRLKPDLRITEVQSVEAASPGLPTADWWELTSFESQPVNLTGWRFNDADGGLTDAFVIGNPVSLGPGETLVFVEGLTAPQFRAWWGATNLPADLQIIPYSGDGLSLGGSGDRVCLWNATTTDTNDTVAQVSFGAGQTGVTFNYDPVTGVFGGLSVLGVHGVVRAAATSDFGSPGRILAPLVQPVLQVTRSGSQVRIAFEAAAGRRYSLEAQGDLASVTWEPTGDAFTATNSLPTFFEKDANASLRFFRVKAE
jgi:hypothetical protein